MSPLIQEQRLNRTFAALADPTRRAILASLAVKAASVQDLAKPFKISQPAVSRHLRVLEQAGLVESGREAQRRPRRLRARPLEEANRWLEAYRSFWDARLDVLGGLLEEIAGAQKKGSLGR